MRSERFCFGVQPGEPRENREKGELGEPIFFQLLTQICDRLDPTASQREVLFVMLNMHSMSTVIDHRFSITTTALVIFMSLTTAQGSVLCTLYNNTALSPPSVVSGRSDGVGFDGSPPMQPPFSAVWSGVIEGDPQNPEWYTFGVDADAGFVRLWVDDHLLVDGVAGIPGANLTAKYAVRVPFYPSQTGARFRLEFTAGSANVPTQLRLLANGSAVRKDTLSDAVPAEQQRYRLERERAETGWNTWLSDDMLTHALLPQGLAFSMSFEADGYDPLTDLGSKLSCDRTVFPATHGLHDVRGEYTEIETLDFAGSTFRVESASVPATLVPGCGVAGGNSSASSVLLLKITTLRRNHSDAVTLRVRGSVPNAWIPRECNVSVDSAGTLTGLCPGFRQVTLRPSPGDSTKAKPDNSSIVVTLPVAFGDFVTFHTCPVSSQEPTTTVAVAQAIGAARERLRSRFATAYGPSKNETFAGMATAIGWNVIYVPLEGIITPVFRGSPWTLSKPHKYVLFEWDTYMASIIAGAVGDTWVSKSNLIRMTKSISAANGGYVAGFWNGDCGEADKSKPPVGALALAKLLERDPNDEWVASLLFDQFWLWNRWWRVRERDSMVAPGSTREMIGTPFQCPYTVQPPKHAANCETGLDNSPLYDQSTFNTSTNTLDSVDVGMTALVAMDAQILANISAKVRPAATAELAAHARGLQSQLSDKMWDSTRGLYFNRKWTNDTFEYMQVAAPTNFYPMLAGTPSTGQVEVMLSRWLTNSSEFCVSDECDFGVPSVSRTSPGYADNSYWRGRAWGPMNYLLYEGLKKYADRVEAAGRAVKALARQSEATFLVEWKANRRVMENFNSITGEGCDVGNAIPFYHWGALNALVGLKL